MAEHEAQKKKADLEHAKKVKDYNELELGIKEATPRRQTKLQVQLVEAGENMRDKVIRERDDVSGREYHLFG